MPSGVRRRRGERQPLVHQARLVREEMHLPANGTERLQLDVAEAGGGFTRAAGKSAPPAPPRSGSTPFEQRNALVLGLHPELLWSETKQRREMVRNALGRTTP